MAFESPDSEEWSFFLVKKLTVKGIIGKTQGVKSAKRPPKNPNPKIRHKELFSFKSAFKLKAPKSQVSSIVVNPSGFIPYKIALAFFDKEP